MKTYLAYHKEGQNIEDVTLIEEGFSFSAFVFGILWLVYKKLWIPASFVLLINVLLGIGIEIGLTSKEVIGVFQFAVLVILGLSASDIQSHFLSLKGYNLIDVVMGKNRDEAQLKLFSKFSNSITI